MKECRPTIKYLSSFFVFNEVRQQSQQRSGGKNVFELYFCFTIFSVCLLPILKREKCDTMKHKKVFSFKVINLVWLIYTHQQSFLRDQLRFADKIGKQQ